MGTLYEVTNQGIIKSRQLANPPTGVTGGFFYNTSISRIQYFNGSVWVTV